MAEVLGGLGGAAALTELLRSIKNVVEICESLWHAPREVKDAENDFQLLLASSERFLSLTRCYPELDRSTDKDSELLKQFVRQAQIALDQIQLEFRHELKAPSFSGRVKWSIWSKQKVDFLMSRLLRIQASVSATMQLVSLRLNHSHFNRIEEKLDLLLTFCQHVNRAAHSSHLQEMPEQIGITSRRVLPSTADAIDQLLTPLNVARINAELQAAHSHDGNVSFGYTVTNQARQVPRMNFINFMLEHEPVHLSSPVTRLASFDSDIMDASAKGDTQRLARILTRSPGSHHCLTIDGLPPLCLAIESGSASTAQLLLDHGVDVNARFGKHNTTALAVALECRKSDMVELLLGAGASFKNRNRYGWSPLFHLWRKERLCKRSCTQLLALLHSNRRDDFDALHQNVYDVSGWSVMHHAAAFGTAEDLHLLLDYGLNPFEVIAKLRKKSRQTSHHDGWSVLQLAIYYGNLDTVKVLLHYYIERYGHVNMADTRGWTSLHIAVERGHLEIARVLLQNGADTGVTTKPTLSGTPGDTKSHRYTPFTLALEAGREYFEQFYAIVKDTQRMLPEHSSQSLQVSLVIRAKSGRRLRHASSRKPPDQISASKRPSPTVSCEGTPVRISHGSKNKQVDHQRLNYNHLLEQSDAHKKPQGASLPSIHNRVQNEGSTGKRHNPQADGDTIWGVVHRARHKREQCHKHELSPG